MSARTLFLGRLIGLYSLLLPLLMAAHRQTALMAVADIVHNPSIMLVLGSFTLIAGLAIVLAHNVWSGGGLAVVVTLVGWISVVKGILLLSLTPEAVVGVMDALHYAQLFYFYMALSGAIGLYLTIGGFRTAAHTYA